MNVHFQPSKVCQQHSKVHQMFLTILSLLVVVQASAACIQNNILDKNQEVYKFTANVTLKLPKYIILLT